MTNQYELVFEQLRQTFADTLDKETSLSSIVLLYRHEGEIRIEVGVPYSLTENVIEVGPYAKDAAIPIPSDFYKRKNTILLKEIISFKRNDLLAYLEGTGIILR